MSFKWHFGCPNKNSENTFYEPNIPQKYFCLRVIFCISSILLTLGLTLRHWVLSCRKESDDVGNIFHGFPRSHPSPLSLGWVSVASPPPISGTQTQPIMQTLSSSISPPPPSIITPLFTHFLLTGWMKNIASLAIPVQFPTSQIHVNPLLDCSVKIVLVDAWVHIFVLCPCIFRLFAFCVSGNGAIWGA